MIILLMTVQCELKNVYIVIEVKRKLKYIYLPTYLFQSEEKVKLAQVEFSQIWN